MIKAHIHKCIYVNAYGNFFAMKYNFRIFLFTNIRTHLKKYISKHELEVQRCVV